MATIGTISPRLTKAGKAAMSALGNGVSLKIDGVTFGTGKYDPTGDEVGMTAQVGGRVSIRAGAKPTPYQIRVISIWNEDVGQVPITEVIWWQGAVPVFVWSVLSTANAISVKTDGVPLVLFSDLGFADSAAGSISYVLDPTESVALAALLEHEVSDADPHTQYLPWSRFPDAMSYLWAKTVSGTANVIELTMGTGLDVIEYLVGQTFRFMPNFSNTGPVTLNVNGLGAKVFEKKAGDALIAGDLIKGAVYDAIFDGTSFKLASQAGATVLNNTLSSVSTTEALTAAMGKKLNDEKLALIAGGTVLLKAALAEYLSVTSAVMNLGADIAAIRIKGFDAWHAGNQLALGTTAATARAALVLGTLALQNANNVNITGGLVKAELGHTSGYLTLGAFSQAVDDGSLLRLWWNGVTETLELRNSDGGFVTISANYFAGNGSKLQALNGSQVTTGTILAARLGILDIGTTPATARAALQLGAAALLGVQSDTADATAGVLMLNGAHGLGSRGGRTIVLSDVTTPIGHYRAPETDPDNPFGATVTVEIERYAASGGIKQTVTSVYSATANREAYRTHNGVSWSKWNECFTSLNTYPLGATLESAYAALALGSMARQNADAVNITGGRVKGILAHDSGYLVISPFASNYDDGSVLRAYWDGVLGRFLFFRSGGTGVAGATLVATGFVGDGSLLSNLNGSQILTGVIAAARLGILNIGTTPATARAALQLGTAALADLTQSRTDSTPGRVLRVGDFGLGGNVLPVVNNIDDESLLTGVFSSGSEYLNPPADGLANFGDGILNLAREGGTFFRLFFHRVSHRIFYTRQRNAGVTITKSELLHTLNQLQLGTTPATARAGLELGNMAQQNANAVNVTGGYVAASLTHTGGYFAMMPFNASYDDGSYARAFWNGNTSTLLFNKSAAGTGPAGITIAATYFQGDGAQLTNLNGSQVRSGVIAPAYLGLLNIGTTPATARAALELGSMASQNSGAVNITGGVITGNYALNAAAAARLLTPRTINNVAFDATANIIVTITPIQAGVAISGQFGRDLGTYSFMYNDTGAIININDEIAGSSLRFSGSQTPSATRPTGTWRCMSYAYPNQAGLFMRMA